MGQVDADKQEEFPVVVGADAVVEPETMMVEAPNALVTGRAMLCRSICPLVADDATENFLCHHACIRALLAFL